MRYVENKGIRTAYQIRRSGKNKTLLFLHGLGGNHTLWKRVTKRLRGYSKILVDFRGHGESTKIINMKDFDIKNFVKDIDLILDKENIKKVEIIGHSFGGLIALEYYKAHPERVDYIILINDLSCHILTKNKFLKWIISRIEAFLGILKKAKLRPYVYTDYSIYYRQPAIMFFLKDMLNMSFRTYLRFNLMLSNYDLKKRIRKVDVPVKIISGSKDKVVPLSENKEFYGYICKINKKKGFKLK